MYSVSSDYLDAIGRNVQSGYISGLIDSVPFTADDVLLGSATVSNKCVDPQNIKLGAVNIGTFKVTFVNNTLVPRGEWENKTISLFWNQLIDDELQTYEQVPVGVYIINEANHAAEGVKVTAYDRMSLLDKDLDFTTSSGSIYSFLNLICNKCHVVLGMSRAEVEALPNGDEVFSVYAENDMKTFRDFLGWVSQTCGTFATFNRFGELELRKYGNTSVMTIHADKRFKGGSFSDFETFYTSISVVDIANQVTIVESTTPNNGLVMNLGSNPLLQYGLSATLERQRKKILGSLADFRYTPFTTSLLGNPIFDLGDVLTFTSGIAGTTSIGCLMEYTYLFNRSYQMRGYGNNPALLDVRSKTDKNISGLNSRINGNEFKYQIYTNAEEIIETSDDGVVYIELATLEFTANRDTVVEVNSCIAYELTFSQNISSNMYRQIDEVVKFIVDGVEESQTLRDFDAVRSRNGDFLFRTTEHYFAKLDVEAGTNKTLKVFLRTQIENRLEGASTSNAANYSLWIPEEYIKIYLRGQGLTVQKSWDGYIILSDELSKILVGHITTEQIEDDVILVRIEPIIETLTDEFDRFDFSSVSVPDIDESLSITFSIPTSNITTEDGEFNIVTENGTYNVVTE